MNNILIITVDATIEHGACAKKCAENCTCINEQKLGLYIINV